MKKSPYSLWACILLILSCEDNTKALKEVYLDARISHIDSVLAKLNKERGFNGNLLIAERDSIIYTKSFGYADYQKGIKLSENTIFNIASISKTFTAVGILLLAEQKKLDLDDKVVNVLEQFPYPQITIRHLLSHTSGIIKEQRAPFFYQIKDKAYDNQRVYELFTEVKPELVFPPGSNYMYSNSNYIFLAVIIEKISDQTYASFLKDNIFNPARMRHTFLHYRNIPVNLLDSVANPHQSSFLSKAPFPVSHQDSTFINMYGEGWIYSTTKDLFQYHQALQEEKILSRESLEEMYAPVVLTDSKEYELNGKTNFPAVSGLAWKVVKDSSSGKIVYHSGGVLGGRTMLFRDITNDRFYVSLTNNDETARHTFSFPFKKLYDKDYVLDKLHLAKQFGKVYTKDGIDTAVAFFKTHKSDTTFVGFSVWDYEDIGKELIKKNDLSAALKLYQLYNSEYPKSSLGHKNMGEVYRSLKKG
ncbi:MAG: serine hydrolase domain-containing protein [Bacteroidota bacterium]